MSITPYFATNSCTETTHYFKRTIAGIVPLHLDDQICMVSEYYLPLRDLIVASLEGWCRNCGSTEPNSCHACADNELELILPRG